MQALLDRHHFSCNCLDGIWGPMTRRALAAWQAQAGLPPTGTLDATTRERLGMNSEVWTRYVVTPEDLESLAPVPPSWAGKARVERLGYETIQELVAERFHLKQAALVHLNPNVVWPNPPEGTELVVPDLRSPAPPAADRLRISLSEKAIRAYDAQDRPIALFPCSIARMREKRPLGELHVTVVAQDPNYVFDPALFAEDPESATLAGKLIIPPGPNNPVGVAWIGLNRPGYGIHGTPRPEDIGKTESHGCFRLANWNAGKLLRMIRMGMPVSVEE